MKQSGQNMTHMCWVWSSHFCHLQSLVSYCFLSIPHNKRWTLQLRRWLFFLFSFSKKMFELSASLHSTKKIELIYLFWRLSLHFVSFFQKIQNNTISYLLLLFPLSIELSLHTHLWCEVLWYLSYVSSMCFVIYNPISNCLIYFKLIFETTKI